MLCYLRRNFSSARSSLKLLFYKTLVRSKLVYPASMWDPFTSNLVNVTELVQNNTATFITNNSTASVHENVLGLPSLAPRRNVLRLSLFDNINYHLRFPTHFPTIVIKLIFIHVALASFIPRTGTIFPDQLPPYSSFSWIISRYCITKNFPIAFFNPTTPLCNTLIYL